jgi:DNA-binding XRE family transcriptional regulator
MLYWRVAAAIESADVQATTSDLMQQIGCGPSKMEKADTCNAGLGAVFGRNVRKFRQQRKLTQEQLAFEAQIDLTYMGGIERGRRNPSLLVMARIAEALAVPLSCHFQR